jgi:hypothetical protein
VATAERELHEQHQNLMAELTAQHVHVNALDPGDAGFGAQYTLMTERLEEVLAFEEALPGRLAEPRRLRSEKIVRWSWRGQTAVAVALIAAVFVFGRSAWWLILLVPHLGVTLLSWDTKVTLHNQHKQVGVAAGLHALGVLVALVALGVLSAWWSIAVMAGWALTVARAEPAQQGAKK